MTLLLALDAALANVGDDRVDAVFINDAHALGGKAQFYPSVLGFDPEFVRMQVGQKAATRPVLACDTLFPLTGFLPVTWQTRDMVELR
jgi:hypothetical protein